MTSQVQDLINSPPHYTHHLSGVECIEIVENMPFCVGNAFKYIFRRKYKDDQVTNLKKALWYVKHAIKLQELDIYTLKTDALAAIVASENINKPKNTWGKMLHNLVFEENLADVCKNLEQEIAYLQSSNQLHNF